MALKLDLETMFNFIAAVFSNYAVMDGVKYLATVFSTRLRNLIY